jgi:hypothetical protein
MANTKYAGWPEERKAVARARAKKWRADNPERAKEYDRKKSAKESAALQEFRLKNPLVRLTKEQRQANNRAYNKRWYAANREYDKQRRAEWYAANIEHRRAITRNSTYKRKYGLTIAEYDAMVVAQGGRCAICGADNPRGVGRWPVDHCSKTGKVRRLLCNGCNPGLGFFKHDVDLLQRAIDYLKEFSPSQSPETSPSP